MLAPNKNKKNLISAPLISRVELSGFSRRRKVDISYRFTDLIAELGTQQHGRNNVTRFSGNKVVGYCIINICHRDLHIFQIFLVPEALHCLKSHFSRLALSKCYVIYHWHVCDRSQINKIKSKNLFLKKLFLTILYML